MYFEKCDRKELNRTLYHPGKNQKLIRTISIKIRGNRVFLVRTKD